jgi:uncharacterized protein (DUF1697 family)
MRQFIAFLRAINVGGHNVTMEELRRLFRRLGLKEVETFIASGNVIFVSDVSDLMSLEAKIERALQRALGYEVKAFIRTPEELASIVSCKPFKESQVRTAQALNVALLADPLDCEATKLVQAMTMETDAFHVQGREVYWLCQTRQSDSKFSNTRFEKLLKTRATWRNLNTIARLAAKYGSSAP